MHKDDIKYGRKLIEKARVTTETAVTLPVPYTLLSAALDELETINESKSLVVQQPDSSSLTVISSMYRIDKPLSLSKVYNAIKEFKRSHVCSPRYIHLTQHDLDELNAVARETALEEYQKRLANAKYPQLMPAPVDRKDIEYNDCVFGLVVKPITKEMHSFLE